MSRLPCIICEGGDVYSHIICDNCEFNIEHRKEVYESMCSLVRDINDIVGTVPDKLEQQVQEKVKPIYNMLCEIEIKDTKKGLKDE